MGADLVVELPFLTSVQSADYFAAGAVDILSRLGIDSLTFGTEEVLDYQAIADVYAEKSEEMEAFVESLPSDLSYPQKTQKMWEKFAGVDFTGNTPNHILGLAYAKACAGKGIKLNPIQRQGAGYHSSDKEVSFASATSLRLHKQDSDFVDKFMPNSKLFQTSPQVSWDNYFQLLVYQILTNPDLTSVFQVNEEIASRLKAAIREVSSVEELVDKVATKRYTKARVRRLLTYILVGAVENPLPPGCSCSWIFSKRAGSSQICEKVCGYSGSDWKGALGYAYTTSRSGLSIRQSRAFRTKLRTHTN